MKVTRDQTVCKKNDPPLAALFIGAVLDGYSVDEQRAPQEDLYAIIPSSVLVLGQGRLEVCGTYRRLPACKTLTELRNRFPFEQGKRTFQRPSGNKTALHPFHELLNLVARFECQIRNRGGNP